MKKKKYDIIYSLGMSCITARQMINFGLRKYSGPFDWLTGASLATRVSLISDDFANWMRPEDMESLAEVCGDHRVYRNKRTNFIYKHDFPEDQTFEESFDEVRKKYERRVRRLYEEIGKAKHALLICICEGGDKDYVRLADMLRERWGKEVDLLVIEHHDDITSPEMKQLCGYVEVWRLRVYDPPEARDEDWWAGNSEFLRPVLSRYAIRVPWWRRKMIIKVLCAFVPLQKWRKQLRGMIQPRESWN